VRPVAVVALLGCYQPSLETGVECATGGICPTPLVCVSHVCVDRGSSPDAGDPDARLLDAYDGPILLLHMDDDPSGGSALDSAGGHAATCTQCPTLIHDARVGSGAYHFVNDEIDVTPAADFTRSGPATLAMWVRIAAAPASFEATAAKNLPPDDASYGMSIGSDLLASYYTSGANAVGNTPLSLDAWHHLAMTWDGTSTVIGYLDGQVDLQYTTSGFPLDGTAPFVVGDVNGSNDLVGDLDELAYYVRALSPNEISLLANP
jgi:hypothetical protein